MRRLLLLALLLAGCPGGHGDYPTRTCRADSDCYQGETCVLQTGSDTGTCVSDEDGGTP